jgi:hypothetical protein
MVWNKKFTILSNKTCNTVLEEIKSMHLKFRDTCYVSSTVEIPVMSTEHTNGFPATLLYNNLVYIHYTSCQITVRTYKICFHIKHMNMMLYNNFA